MLRWSLQCWLSFLHRSDRYAVSTVMLKGNVIRKSQGRTALDDLLALFVARAVLVICNL